MKNNMTQKTSAMIAAISLLLMAVIAPIANFVLLEGLIKPGDAAQTLQNVVASEHNFRLVIFIFLMVVLLDIIVAWALYLFLKPIDPPISLLSAWLRLIYSAMLAVSLYYLIDVLNLIGSDPSVVNLQSGQFETHVLMLIQGFKASWEFSLIIFGFHVLGIGYLILKAGYMKKILGILLLIAGAGYCIDGIGHLLSPEYNVTISMFTFIGEVVLIFWLFIGGRKVNDIATVQR